MTQSPKATRRKVRSLSTAPIPELLGGDLLEGLAVTQSRKNALVQQGFRSWDPSGFIQDDWRVKPWLTLNLGVRYDMFTPYTEVHGRIANYDPFIGLLVSPSLPGLQQSNSTAMVATPNKDLAPRFGFAATLGHGMVLRGGAGLTFFPTNYQSSYFLLNAPFNYAESCTLQNNAPGGGTNNSCATAQFDGPPGQFSNGVTSVYGTPNCPPPAPSCSTRSTSTIGQHGGALLSAGLPVPTLNAALALNQANYGGTTIIGLPINYQEAYLEQFNLQLQKQFGANVVQIGYVGELGRHAEVRNLPQNQVTEPSLSSTPPLTVGGQTPLGILPGFPLLKSLTLTESNNWGTTAYHGLQTSFVRRFNKGLTVNVNYTWSHTMSNINNFACVSSYFAAQTPCLVDTSNGTGASAPRQVFNFPQYAWGNDSLDVADRITWGVNYQIPFGKSMTGIEGAFLKGWGVNTSGSWQTGLPFSVSANTNTSGLSQTQLLDQVGTGRLANPTIHQWFNFASFVQPAANTLGDQHILQLFGPAQKRLDASLFKEFPIKEQIRLQFRTEVFNLFNQTNFGQPDAPLLSPSTGTGV